MSTRTSARAALLVTAVVAVTGGVASCSAPPAPNCLPSTLHVQPSTFRPGSTITVSSVPAVCTFDRGTYGDYKIHLRTARADTVLGSAVAGDHGEFRTVVQVPSDVPVGRVLIAVSGSAFDYCDDPSAGCAAFEQHAVVTPGH
ncbi:hypothetical protein [Cellulomonas alba]|uniref:Lipoprotein n=1 Tax=Cellulomonas alba TaxID=3053467 RepID=A0ABT7SE09_9CELL|nr:hypothetical protein [Cellulomonas alba]MDM7853769.1 hypothetical protein [Cellulomonas alba]